MSTPMYGGSKDQRIHQSTIDSHRIRRLWLPLAMLGAGLMGGAALAHAFPWHIQADQAVVATEATNERRVPSSDMEFEGSTARPTSLVYSPDGSILAAGYGYIPPNLPEDRPLARFWDARTGESLGAIPVTADRPGGTVGTMTPIRWHPDGRHIFAQIGPEVRMFAREDGGVVRSFKQDVNLLPQAMRRTLVAPPVAGTAPLDSTIASVEVDGDRLVAMNNGGDVWVFAIATGRPILAFNAFDHQPTLLSQVGIPPTMTIIPGRNRLIAATPRWMVKRSLADGKMLGMFPGDNHLVRSLAVSSDGLLLATGSMRGTDSVWDIATRLPVATQTITARSQHAFQIAISPDGHWMISGDGRSPRPIMVNGFDGRTIPIGEHAAVIAVTFSPDGRHILTGGQDMKIHRWPVGELIGSTREQAPPNDAELERLIEVMSGQAQPDAYRAMRRLLAAEERSLAHLRPIARGAELDRARLDQWIAQLDDSRFAVRQEAEKSLLAQGYVIVEHLRHRQRGELSVEAKAALEAIIEELDRPENFSDSTRAMLRARWLLRLLENEDSTSEDR
ncbi:MAG: hypothetical protein JJU36_13705 [Phycisphaeraceae bacterium]|nr:hypothetical protein [Phycisphaeraceae bacterium]